MEQKKTEQQSKFITIANELDASVNQLEENIKFLGNKIAMVLKPNNDPTCDKACEEKDACSEIESWVKRINSRIRECNYQLSNYRDRCCL